MQIDWTFMSLFLIAKERREVIQVIYIITNIEIEIVGVLFWKINKTNLIINVSILYLFLLRYHFWVLFGHLWPPIILYVLENILSCEVLTWIEFTWTRQSISTWTMICLLQSFVPIELIPHSPKRNISRFQKLDSSCC